MLVVVKTTTTTTTTKQQQKNPDYSQNCSGRLCGVRAETWNHKISESSQQAQKTLE